MKAIWFRNDLRVQDNPALSEACRSRQPVIAFYFHTPDQLEQHQVGHNKQRFIIENLVALSTELNKLGIPLVARRCRFFHDSVTTLRQLCRQYQVADVYLNQEYEINEQQRDTEAFATLTKAGINLHRCHDQVLLPPGSVLTGQGHAFRVFTPFKRSWIKQAQTQSLDPLPAPNKRQRTEITGTPASEIDSWMTPQPANALWPAGSREAYRRLDSFIEKRLHHYNSLRDFPAIDATSQLSPYLAVGAISQRTCLHAALSANHFEWDSGNQGILTWISELVWREFYKHLVFHFPDLCKGRCFQPVTNAIRWDRNPELLRAWQDGRTGYPLVDAAMQQLRATGWMHNRLRMVSAMFLTKHLFIDWRLGEAWFMRHLIDADFAANNGGWQWSASTGADAAPYFRVFNPTRQSERFDPQGEFISRWLPELKDLHPSRIHDPGPMERQLCKYPGPIVDHRTVVARVKAEFQAVKAMEIA